MARVPSAQHPLVAREGRLLIGVVFVGGLVVYYVHGGLTALPFLPALAFLGYFFRDPHRDSPSLPLAVVAPCDGVIVEAGAARDPWLGRDAVCVSIAMGLLDVHSLFSPTEGKLLEQWSAARFAEDPARAPRHAVAYQVHTDEGDDVTLEIGRGPIGGGVQIGYQPGERVGHGRRVGYAALGCRVRVFAHAASRLEVSAGQHVTAAASVVLTLVHDSPVSAIPEAEAAGED